MNYLIHYSFINTFQKKYFYIQFVCLSFSFSVCRFICLSVHLLISSRKYSLNNLKFMYVFDVYYSLLRTENLVCWTNGSSAGAHKCIPIQCGMSGNYLKCNLITICSSNFNKIIVHYSDA